MCLLEVKEGRNKVLSHEGKYPDMMLQIIRLPVFDL
jgi:hypothetical protein